MLVENLDPIFWLFAILTLHRKAFGSIVWGVWVQMSSQHQSLSWSIGKSVEPQTWLRCTTHLQAGHLDTRASHGLACSIYHYSFVPNSGFIYPFYFPQLLPNISPPLMKSPRHLLPTKRLTQTIIIETFAIGLRLHRCTLSFLPWFPSAQHRTSLFLDGSTIVIMASTFSLEA